MAGQPRTIGRYEVEHLLGSGAFGDVFLATLHGAMGFRKRVAIKVIGKDRPGCDPRKIGGFVNEARLGETLHHPNIVAIVEFGQDQGDYFLVMEYIDGISLQGILSLCAGRHVLLPEDAVCELGVQVCAGLDHAHNATSEAGEMLDLVHRDLKPANLMVDRAGTVRIVDFGIARASTNPYFTTRTGEVKGTPRYMAPEQVTGRDTVSPLVDLYSLGLVLCEMATGKPVFAAANIEALLYQVVNGDVSSSTKQLRKVAPHLYPVVIKALQRDPHERFQTAAEMSERLRDVWWTLGGRQRMGLVVQATRNLVPEMSSVPTLKPTIATVAVNTETAEWSPTEERSTGPATWSSFCQAFSDQISEEPPDADTGSSTVPVRPRAERTLLPILLGIAALLAVVLLGVLAFPLLFSEPPPVDEVRTAEPPEPPTATPPAATEASSEGIARVDALEPEPPAAEPTPSPSPTERVAASAPPPPVQSTEPSPESTPAAATADTGQVRVNSVPWSKVYVDGEYLGRTGVPAFDLAVGHHLVRLDEPQSGQRKSFRVHITKDATAVLGCWNFETASECGE